MKRLLLTLVTLALCTGLQADGPSHILDTGVSKIKAATPKAEGSQGAFKDLDVDIMMGDARMVPRFIRRSKGSYETVYDPKLVLPLWTMPRYQTLITIPKGERILEVMAADDDVWETLKAKNANQAWIKPYYPNAATTITIITMAGNRYIFEATSGEANKGHEPIIVLDVLAPAWLKQKLEETARPVQGRGARGGGAAVVGGNENSGSSQMQGGDYAGSGDGISLQEVNQLKAQSFATGHAKGVEEATARQDDVLRQYAFSLFGEANMDYKWSKGNPKLRIKRAFDDGRNTFILFESALNTQPAFWEVAAGGPKEVTTQTASWNPNVLVIMKLFKEGTLSVDKEEVKIFNKGWHFQAPEDPKVQMRGDRPGGTR